MNLRHHSFLRQPFLGKQWLQLIAFNIFWLICVLGQNQWLMIQVGVLLLFFYLFSKNIIDVTRIVIFIPGIFIDLVLIKLGVFIFSEFPIWLVSLWIGFAYCLEHGFAWLNKLKMTYIALLGGIAGPLSYYAGLKLNAVEFGFNTSMTLMILAIIWAMLLPLLVFLNNRFRKL